MVKRRAVVLAAVAVAGGCGGGSSSAPPARLPHALGVRLAAESSAVEASLRARNSCAAVTQAAHLQNSVSLAIEGRRVPAALRRPLAKAAARLALSIRCVPPAPSPPKPKPPHPHKPPHGPDGHHKHDPGPGPGPGDAGGG